MESTNFEFLRPQWPELASLGGFAEAYAHPDPVGALVKLRTYGEQLVEFIYHKLRLPRPHRAHQIDLLQSDSFKAIIPPVVMTKLHSLRIQGNKAAHGEKLTRNVSLWILQEAYDLGRWLFLTHGGGKIADCPAYVEPTPEGKQDKLKQQNKAFLEKLAAQEAKMEQLLKELESTRAKAEAAQASVEELQAAQTAGTTAVDTLSFDEKETRKHLVDALLIEAGWDVGANGKSTEEVGQEVPVDHQPTESGKGFSDYVLYDTNGKPLGVIETKKTAVDPEAGRTQAKCYADGLEQQHGQRPVIFYTNGYDLWIWNDAQQEPPRKIYGFYSKDSLQYLHFQNQNRQTLSQISPSPEIAGRMYQIEAVRRVAERFAEKKRKALIVQATGTGKTRVAISLCEALIRANWAKRILFLCDRRELRKQAQNVFKEYLPGETRTIVSSDTAKDRKSRIYLGTYPALMKCYESFDTGFFDLIIADESHRSIYNRYRELFQYFDAYQVGLTATPVKDTQGNSLIPRDTYEMFECDADDPTASFSYEEAINHNPAYLVPFVVETHTTPFLREGIKYTQMNRQQRHQLELDEVEPELIEHDREAVDKRIFNKDTNRLILKNLMTHGIKDASSSRVGKTIVFARSHNHAQLMQDLFDEMYPQYGGNFCRVIDNYDPRAEELIDDFKGEGKNPDLTIAISVDMMDTGIDVPEVVNLVFAKPVYSYVKFWQMIGRGTRLCLNLFGAGNDKTHFMIFDHWGNFEWFEEKYKPVEARQSKSLRQQVFETRVELANLAQTKDQQTFQLAVDLIGKDIAALPEKSVSVREKWKEIKTVQHPEVLQKFEAATRSTLLQDVAPLMQWINIGGHEEAYKFDKLVCLMQIEHLKGSSRFDDHKTDLLTQVAELRVNLSQVAEKAETISEVKSTDFWNNATPQRLEEMRGELRGIMQYRAGPTLPKLPPKVIDVAEDPTGIERERRKVSLQGMDLVAYRNRVLSILTDLFETNETLKKIKAGEPVSETDLEALVSLVLTQDPTLDLHDLEDYYPETAGHLDKAIRGIIGMDAEAVHDHFEKFVQKHPNLASHQIKFLDLLQNHLAKYGSIEIDRLYEPPFTSIHSDSLDGLFDESLAEELLSILESFKTPEKEERTES